MEGEYWKVTRPDRFGWTVLAGDDGTPEIAEAPPLEYLERWRDSNRFLGDLSTIRGVSETEDEVQIVISQPFIEGPYPVKSVIVEEFRKYGFAPVPGFSIGSESDSSFYNDTMQLGIFDGTCDNFILSQELAIPVDVIAIPVGDRLRSQLLTMIEP